MPLELELRTRLATSVREKLEQIVGPQRTLEDVMRWGLAQTPPKLVVSVVVQDEYTHDVVIDHGDGNYLVYDTT